MNPLVSIILPVYNCEKYIEKCLNSLLEQKYNNIEIIVVNDGSEDHSHDIITSFTNKNKNIIYICQENKGVSEARNVALQKAMGDYFLFVDGDDYVGNSYISDMIECAEKNCAELVLAGITSVTDAGDIIEKIAPLKYERFQSEEWAYRMGSAAGRLYKRDFWQKYSLGFVQEKGSRAEDVPNDLFSNVMAQNIGIVDNAEYYYVQHAGSAMNDATSHKAFLFPFIAFEQRYKQVREMNVTNSIDFFNMGVLKLFAMFEFQLYKYASKEQKEQLKEYTLRVLKNDFRDMRKSWRRIRLRIDLPVTHKVAIELFIVKYKYLYKIEGSMLL